MGIKHDASYRSGENMAKKTDEELYDVAINMIGSVAKLPVIRVDREAFLRQQFANSNISMRFWSMAHSMYIRRSRCEEKRMG